VDGIAPVLLGTGVWLHGEDASRVLHISLNTVCPAVAALNSPEEMADPAIRAATLLAPPRAQGIQPDLAAEFSRR